MDDLVQRLDDLAQRIELMALAPDEVEARWMWLARPFYRLLGWQPHYDTQALDALLAALRRENDAAHDSLAQRLERAAEELEDNIARGERACVLNGEIATSHVAWLGRVTRVVARIGHSLERDLKQAGRRALKAIDPVLVAKPLAIAVVDEKGELQQPAGKPRAPTSATADQPADRSQARLVELQLAAIDHVIDAARAETAFLDRRRRLLEAARRLLLDASAALPLDDDGVRLRKRYLAEQIVHVDRVQASGLRDDVALLHQAQAALSRKHRGRLHAALAAMEGFALAAGDDKQAGMAGDMLDLVAEGRDTAAAAARTRSIAQSAGEMFGREVTRRVDNAYDAGRSQYQELFEDAPNAHDREVAALALEYLTPGSESGTMAALLSVDGCFDVGAPLAPVRIRDRRTVARVVSHPTQELLLSHAKRPEDLAAAVIQDPRRVLLDLCTGRLLTRKYVHYEQQIRERTEMMGEARVYLLDASTSMMTDGEEMARARMRDAILVAELSTLIERFKNPQRFTRVLLFYRYFTKRIGPVVKIDSLDEAISAVSEVLSTPRRGGTDIEQALAASFDVIREATGRDPDLERAQIVLVTDGNATVRDDVVQQARKKLGSMPINVSVIALGEENPALRRLVARQRAAGERAFYHFIDDRTLAELCAGDFAVGRALHLPSELDAAPSAQLEENLAALLDEVADLDRARHVAIRSEAQATGTGGGGDDLLAAFRELGLPLSALSDGQRALRDAAARDLRAVMQRYERWFPRLDPNGKAADALADDDSVDAAVVVLSTVAEVVAELGGDSLTRSADAIDVVERLLPDARLSPARFEELMHGGSPRIREGLAAVHAATSAKVR